MSRPKNNTLTTILKLCLLTGALDAIAALLISYKISPAIIFQYIASGWFGKAAFSGGTMMVIAGVLSHFLIASIYSTIFFFLYPIFKQFIKNKWVIGIIIGLMIWAIMNLAVLPLTNIPKHPMHFNIGLVEGIAALIICVGIPIAVIADRYYYGGRSKL